MLPPPLPPSSYPTLATAQHTNMTGAVTMSGEFSESQGGWAQSPRPSEGFLRSPERSLKTIIFSFWTKTGSNYFWSIWGVCRKPFVGWDAMPGLLSP